ncbi:hypothetical protein F2Q68_00005515 [Brassica cretica]|uniref:Uncharacterized protein n=1 Tax=Brassica cretica TaxID=69181 RepID=A0A8S9JFU8_BRACR|nr:hypothetical protein F2Q68_00005515 [Brassica cretica]
MSKKKGVSAEIQLHEVIANIDLLNELKNGDLTVDAELARLKEMEGDCEDLVASAAMSDWSISKLYLPQVSDDSLDQVGGSSVPDDSASTVKILFVWVVEIRQGLDPYKASLCFKIYHSVSFNFVFACQRYMASRRSNPRDSDRVRTRTGSANAERIRSGDVSKALTEVLREEIRLPRTSTQEARDLEGEKSVSCVKSSSPTGSEGRDRPPKKAKTNGSNHRLGVLGEAAVAKPFHWQFSHSKDCPITEDPDSVAHLVRHFKPAGCLLPSLRNMTEHKAYVKMAVAHAKAMEVNNESAATLEKRLQDVPCSDELYEIKKVVRELKLGLKMAQDRERANAAQLAAAEKLGNQAASLEARLRVDIRRASRVARRDIATRYREILESLKDKWMSKKKGVSAEIKLHEVIANIDLLNELKNGDLTVDAELACLKEMEGDCEDLVASAAVSDWSISELDLPQVSDDSLDQEIRLPRTSTQEARDLEGEKSVARVKSSSPTGSEGRDRPPKKAKTNGSDHRLGVLGEAAVAKPFHWQFSHSKDCPITEDLDSVAHLVRHFKPAGCPLPSLRNMTEHKAYVKMAVAHAKVVLFDTRSLLNLSFVLSVLICYAPGHGG